MSEVASPKKEAGYLFQFAVGLSEGSQLNISVNLPVGASASDMNTELDKLTKVTDRIRAKYKISAKEDEIASGHVIRKAMEEDLHGLDAKYAGKTNVPTAEKNNREAMVSNIKRLGAKIASHETELEALKKMAE